MKFHVLTEQELLDLLQAQRQECANQCCAVDDGFGGLTDFNEEVLNANTPPLPKLLSEWGIINKITKI